MPRRERFFDKEALFDRYRKEIKDLKQRLAEQVAEARIRARRLAAQEVRSVFTNMCLSAMAHTQHFVAVG